MSSLNRKEQSRIYRHDRIRKKSLGTSERPRLCVHRSLKNLTAQVIDDQTGKIIIGMSTLSKNIRGNIKNGGNQDGASQFGEAFAKEAQKKGIKKVCFDRGGYLFHGRVKAFAEGARKGGLEF
ncbi:MAG: 50S ribosomal protein L18 [Candidatus Omnitrophica bacterium]|nr:50S ribosomal protein L18 [Candidatus Omnitrophota bacterium]